jgi:hypothetical protein
MLGGIRRAFSLVVGGGADLARYWSPLSSSRCVRFTDHPLLFCEPAQWLAHVAAA